MAYCTQADIDYLKERGWQNKGDGFDRVVDGCVRHITPVWAAMRPGSADVPPGEQVFWAAASASITEAKYLAVVRLADQQQTPISAYVTAEVRGWKCG